MPEILTIPCLDDNYAFLIGDDDTGKATLVDVPDAAPINAMLAEKGWTLSDVILTHHHWDHIDGLPGLDGASHARIIGASADAHRLPHLHLAVAEGDTFQVLGQDVLVIDVSGHTVGHLAFYIPSLEAAFTADSLMAMGCGRLFEGTPAQMWESLKKLRALPANTIIYSGHEYTASNMAFAKSLGEDNEDLDNRANLVAAMREQGLATVPSLLGAEMATNPFLRADVPSLMQAVGMDGADPTDVFTEIRKRKDNF